ncbi:phage tail sheath family protein [Methanobacterium formicicum]|uniref:phage tail sheath family protein n=1 Tax=Methanobacterium formicicum TaxID=2162 RepID=UPI00241256AE|nr:phage tail sheath C-terminal domain-containing protein [Methanobacterium formicicum]MDG3548128.1 phage tail sheath subtilisin-like domain-containing protein [Methanobacterium formicicum]
MPEYLTPGVYVEEIEIGAKPIEGVSTSTAGFLGKTERGPTAVHLVTSFESFKRIYGSYIPESYLAYAVEGFFNNGGKRCFIGRIVGNNAEKSSTTTPFKIDAVGAGTWGDKVGIIKDIASRDLASGEKTPKFFKLIVGYWQNPDPKTASIENADYLEIHDNLSEDPTSSEYYVNKLSEPKNESKLIKVSSSNPGNNPGNNPRTRTKKPEREKKNPEKNNPEKKSTGHKNTPNTQENIEPSKTPQFLTGGKDGDNLTAPDFKGSDKIGAKTGLTAFEEIDEISIVYAPDIHKLADDTNKEEVMGKIILHCENLKDRFAIFEAFNGSNDIATLRTPKDTKYAAFYYPWVEIYDPLVKGPNFVPPGGHIAGIYARSDTERGVHKAPANEVVRGVNDLEFIITGEEQGSLNPKGVNCIRSFPARGIRVWGARTMSSDPLWKYINVRRLFLYLEESIDEGTQWVVFEPNDEKLWDRVKQTITQFLTQVWKDGALMGTKAEEAFFVKCDRTTMTQNDIDNGRLIVIIGVSPVKPAEFVIFRIAQWTAGAKS